MTSNEVGNGLNLDDAFPTTGHILDSAASGVSQSRTALPKSKVTEAPLRLAEGIVPKRPNISKRLVMNYTESCDVFIQVDTCSEVLGASAPVATQPHQNKQTTKSPQNRAPQRNREPNTAQRRHRATTGRAKASIQYRIPKKI